MSTIGQNLRDARLQAGHENASAFARAVGVTPTTIYRIERDLTLPSVPTLRAWAVECGVSSDSLLGLNEERAQEAA